MSVLEETHNHLELPWESYENVSVLARIQSLITGNAIIRGGIVVRPNVQAVANALKREFGLTDFGTYIGHSPPEGPTQAVDIFTSDSMDGYLVQDKVCEYLIQHQVEYGVRYLIRREYIWNIERATEGWRWQGHQGNRTADHYDHVHCTCYKNGGVIIPPPTEIGVNDMKVRYIWGPDGLHRTDWVFDGPSRIFAQVGVVGVLNACDKNGFPELGLVDDQTHSWFRDVAAGWRGND